MKERCAYPNSHALFFTFLKSFFDILVNDGNVTKFRHVLVTRFEIALNNFPSD